MMGRKLYVLSDVSLRNEIWAGLSTRDAAISLLAAVCTAGLFLLPALVLRAPVPVFAGVLAALLAGMISVGLLSRMPGVNRSILDQIGIALAYGKAQKQYHYIYRRKVPAANGNQDKASTSGTDRAGAGGRRGNQRRPAVHQG